MMLPRELLAACARNYPGKTAYFCGRQSRSWKQMDERSDRLAHVLSGLGLQPGQVVAILAQESLTIYEHFFACMKLGLVRLGLNWRYSGDELAWLMQDSGARVLIVDERCLKALGAALPGLQAAGVRVIGLGHGHGLALDYEALLAGAPAGPAPRPAISGDDALMLTYTSGTTGHPKGVLHRQSAISAMIFQSLIARGLSPDDTWYTAAASSWMTVVLNLLGLGNGMSTVITDGVFDIAQFLADVERHRATAIMLVPTMIQRALQELRRRQYDLSSVRLLMYGSSPATPQLIHDAYAAFGCEMIQSYGMTEAGWLTQLSAADHRRAIASEPALLRSAGRAGVLAEISVRDEQGHPVPPGTVGEVWVRAPTLMLGYLNRQGETEEALHDGWLCSNDIGHLDERGYLFLTDRKKFMIISGAVNIFPSGIEAVLAGHGAVAEVAVVGAPHPEWGEAVVAVIRVHDIEEAPTVEELHAFCQERLNRMERPKHFLFVDEFPHSVNGKIQKQQVKDWVRSQVASLPWSSTKRPPIPPHTTNKETA